MMMMMIPNLTYAIHDDSVILMHYVSYQIHGDSRWFLSLFLSSKCQWLHPAAAPRPPLRPIPNVDSRTGRKWWFWWSFLGMTLPPAVLSICWSKDLKCREKSWKCLIFGSCSPSKTGFCSQPAWTARLCDAQLSPAQVVWSIAISGGLVDGISHNG